ncbi:MAG: tol-pal system protein YbgF [Burkholderiales bacterium]
MRTSFGAIPAIAAANLAAILFATAPAYAGLFDDEEARKKIAEQQQQVEKLQAQSLALEQRLGKLEEVAKDKTGTLELLGQIEALTQEVRSLRGRIEEQGHAIESAGKRQKDFYVDLDSRLRRLEQAAAAAPPAPPAASSYPGAAPATPGAAPDPGTPTAPAAHPASSTPSSEAPATSSKTTAEPRLPPTPQWAGPVAAPDQPGAETPSYDAAYALFKAGDYQGAIGSFGNFLKTYPRSPLAPSAQYWIGNSYYAARDYQSAISSQQKLLAAYPDSQKAADAWLNIASSQLELGQTATAKKTLEDLVAKYPISEAAEKAKKRLASLK